MKPTVENHEPVKERRRMSDDAFNRWVKLIERLGTMTALVIFGCYCILECAKWAAPMVEENVRNSNAVLKVTAETNVKNAETQEQLKEIVEKQSDTLEALKDLNEKTSQVTNENKQTILSIETIVNYIKKKLDGI